MQCGVQPYGSGEAAQGRQLQIMPGFMEGVVTNPMGEQFAMPEVEQLIQVTLPFR